MKSFVHGVGLFLFLCCSTALPVRAQERLTLNDAIEMALRNNPDIFLAEQEIHVAEGRILQAGKISNPELDLEWNEIPTNFNFGDADEQLIGLRQDIEFPTKRSRRKDVAAFNKEIAELRLERTKTIIRSQVKKGYYAVLIRQDIVNSLEGQLNLLKDFQQLVQSRFESGASNYLDVVRSKVEIARSSNDLADARREQEHLKTQLALLLGESSDRVMQLADTIAYIPILLKQDSLIRQLEQRSATFKIAQRTVAREESVLGLANTSYLPDFTLGLSYQRTAEQPPFNANDFNGVTTNSFNFQLGFSVPLWFWNEPRGLVQEAEALVSISHLSSAATGRRIRANIANALRAVNVAEAQLQLFDRSLLADVDDILETGINQYRNNQIDVLNLIDIYRTYRATRLEYARALMNQKVALADLEASAELVPSQE